MRIYSIMCTAMCTAGLLLSSCSAKIQGELVMCWKEGRPCLGRRVFVTSQTYDPNLGGRTGADAKCNAVATAAGLQQSYIAFLNTEGVDAFDTVDSITVPFLRDESGALKVIADSFLELEQGSIQEAPRFTELNSDIGTVLPYIAHGTTNGLNCGSWSSNAGNARVGDPRKTNSELFAAASGFLCSGIVDLRILCVATDLGD